MNSIYAANQDAFGRFVAGVEAIVGHSIDGDEDADGFSIDSAHDAFKAGQSADEYAELICRRWRVA